MVRLSKILLNLGGRCLVKKIVFPVVSILLILSVLYYRSRYQTFEAYMPQKSIARILSGNAKEQSSLEAPPLFCCSLINGVSKSEAAITLSLNALEKIADYLKIKDITNLRQVANPNTTRVFMLKEQSQFKIGETISVKIELHDGWGRHLLTGGDILRIWMTDRISGANSNGYVIDHGNGSYTGVVHAFWTGNVEIKMSIACTKEHIGIVLNHIKEHGLLFHTKGQYVNKKLNATEDTKCTTIPRVKGYDKVCNFTSENFGMAWYCGAPKSTKLSCKDWTFQSGAKFFYLSEIAQNVLKHHKHMQIPQTFNIRITGDYANVQSKDIPCNRRPKKSSWHDVSPTGYFYHNHWHVLECKFPFNATKTNYIKCLKGRPVVLLGDSTSRAWFVYLSEFLNLKFTVGRWDEIKDKAWQKFASAERKDLNISVVWAPHELPFYGSLAHKSNLRSVGSRLDEIGSNSRAIIVLNWYLHIARSSHEVYREHIRNARHAIDRLLKRSPNVEILIKGPHAVTYPANLEGHDFVRRYQEQILFEEFRDIQDRVVYLEEWDITSGSENINVHPSRLVDGEMIHHLLSNACFR